MNKKGAGLTKSLGNTLECEVNKISSSILELDRDTENIKAFISFNKVPLEDDFKIILDGLNINIDNNTWLFDYVLSNIPKDSLCSLVDLDNVKSIFIPTKK
jgi:hypothetical protein